MAPVHVAAWRAVRGPFVPVLRHVVRVQVRVAARAQRLVHVHKMAPGALVPKNGHAATAPVQHQAGRHAVHEAKRAEDRPIGVAQAPRPEEATYQPGPQRRRARQLLQRRPRVARPPAPAAALSCRAVRRPPAGGRGHDAVLSPFPSHYIYIYIYIYGGPSSPPFAPLYAPRQSTASFVIGPQHARLRKVNAEIMFFAGRKTEEAEIAVLVALVIGGGGGPCYRWWWWWPLLSVVVVVAALVVGGGGGGGPCCRWWWWWRPLLSVVVVVAALVIGGGGGGGPCYRWWWWWRPLLSVVVVVAALVIGGGGGCGPCYRWWWWWRPLLSMVVVAALVINGGGGGPCYQWWWWWPLLSMVVVVALVINGGGGPCYRWWWWWWPLLSMVVVVVALVINGGGGPCWGWPLLSVALVCGGPCCRRPLFVVALVGVGGGWWPLGGVGGGWWPLGGGRHPVPPTQVTFGFRLIRNW